jgi:hypothetical protein
MEVVPEDYGSRELVQLLNLIRQSLPIEGGVGFCAADALAVP